MTNLVIAVLAVWITRLYHGQGCSCCSILHRVNFEPNRAWRTCQFGFAVGFGVGLRAHHCILGMYIRGSASVLAVMKILMLEESESSMIILSV